MDLVGLHGAFVQWFERSHSDVQCKVVEVTAQVLYRFDECRRKVQAGGRGRRGDRLFRLGIDCLISVSVGSVPWIVLFPIDVGGKRHFAKILGHTCDGSLIFQAETYAILSLCIFLKHGGIEFVYNGKNGTLRKLFSWL